MSINFDNGNLYSRVGKWQIGGAAGYSEALGKASQAADETAQDEVDNRGVGKDYSTGEVVYGERGGAPQTSILGLFGNWLYGLFHGGPREETGFVQTEDNGIPVQDGEGISVDTVLAPEEMPQVPEASTTGGTV